MTGGSLASFRDRASGRPTRAPSKRVGDDYGTFSGGVVRFVERLAAPGEPLQGRAQAGPFVLDVSAAGGVVGVSGAAVLRAAVAALVPQEQNIVIMTADCAAELYGGGPKPAEVTIVATLDEAIGYLHAELSERIRDREDGVAERHRPMWLFARAATQLARLRALYDEAAPYGINAILAGHWPFALSVVVDDQGRVLASVPEVKELTGAHLAVLPAELVQGRTEASETGLSLTDTGPNAVQPSVTEISETSTIERGVGSWPSGTRPRLRILGPVAISMCGRDLPGLLERRFSWEVATYLACHPDGASLDSIIEDLWPSEPLHSARKRFNDALYHLRKALRAASDDPETSFVSLRMNRYQIDHGALETDLWDFDAAIRAGRAARDEDERLDCFQRAVELYGDLIHIGDGVWAEAHQHDLRRKALSDVISPRSTRTLSI